MDNDSQIMSNNNFSKYSHVSTRKGFSGNFIERRFLRLPGHNSIEFWTYTVMYIFTPLPSCCLNSKMNLKENFPELSRKFQNFCVGSIKCLSVWTISEDLTVILRSNRRPFPGGDTVNQLWHCKQLLVFSNFTLRCSFKLKSVFIT